MIFIDFETRSKADITRTGAYRYAQDPTTDILCMAYAIDDGPVQLWVPSHFDLPADYEETRTAELIHKRNLAEKRIEKYKADEDSPRAEELLNKAINEVQHYTELLNFDKEQFELNFNYHTEVPAFIKDKDIFMKIGGGILEAHNASFEQAIWQNILVPRYGAFEAPPIYWADSMALCAVHNIPLSLEKAGAALGLDQQKDLEGKKVMLQLSKPRRPSATNPKEWWEPVDVPDKFEELFAYCMDDVATERALGNALSPLIRDEKHVWLLDQMINQRGVGIDTDLVHKCLDLIKEHGDWGKKRIKEITNGEVTSVSLVAKLRDWVKSQGVDVDDMAKATVERLLADETTPPNVREALEIRLSLSKASTKKLNTMLQAKGVSDDKIRYVLLYHGASTGRWAGRLIQVQNFPRGTIKDVDVAISDLMTLELEELQEKYDDIMEVISSCLRGMIVPSDGHDFLVSDYSAIEARIVMWYAEEEEALEKFAQGVDLYKDMAAYVYDKDIADVDDSDERQLGKAIILGAGFGMGPDKFQATTAQVGLELSEEMAKNAIKAYREKYSGVPEFWRNMESKSIDAVRTGGKQTANRVTWYHNPRTNFLECLLPSGRTLHYYDPKIRLQWAVKWIDLADKFHFDKYNDKSEAEQQFATKKKDPNCKRLLGNQPQEMDSLTHMGVNSTTKQWERQETYGGKLVENIVQGTARDCMVHGMFNTERKKYLTIMTIHDEIVAEVPEGEGSLEEFESLLSETPAWASGLHLKAADGWRGKRYRK